MNETGTAGEETELFTIRLKPEIKKRLFAMAGEVGNPAASFVRPLINEMLDEYDRKKQKTTA